MKKEMKGITLIALAVTIVILSIVAGVSVTMITDDGGVISQANRAKLEAEQDQILEK